MEENVLTWWVRRVTKRGSLQPDDMYDEIQRGDILPDILQVLQQKRQPVDETTSIRNSGFSNWTINMAMQEDGDDEGNMKIRLVQDSFDQIERLIDAKLVNISPRDIVNGNKVAILAVLRTLMALSD